MINNILDRRFSFVLAGIALLFALVISNMAFQSAALAAESSVKTASVTPSYANPVTGVIEDSAGQSNVALAESMVTGCVYNSALVETDAQGNTFVTLRFKLADKLGDMQFSRGSAAGDSFEQVTAQQMQTDSTANTVDYRFAVSSSTDIVRVSMFVTPMGRSVVFFATLADLQDGNADGFVQTIAPGESKNADTGAAAGESAASESVTTSTAGEGEDAATQSSDTTGISEYNAEGQKVSEASEAPLSGAALAGVIGAVVVVIAIAGVAIYVVRVKPSRERAAAAANAARPKPYDHKE